MMAHAKKPDFVFRRNGLAHLNRRGRQFSRLLAAEVCASAVVMLDTPCSEVLWRVLATHSIRQFPLHFPSRASPCAIIFQLDSNCCGILGMSSSNLGPDTDDPPSREFLVKCWWALATGHDRFLPHPVSSLFTIIVTLYPTIQGWRQRGSQTSLMRFAQFVSEKNCIPPGTVQYTDNTSSVLWVRTHNTATSVIIPQILNNFCYYRMTVHRDRFLVNETNRCNEFQFYWYCDSTCFG